jgi:2-amino-4-hydroxy-6-hydroxymethyldihydropteridine diphosphokinase
MSQHQLILSLGGNLGKKSQIFSDTYRLIEKNIGIITRLSSIYQTPPWGFKSKRDFWNQITIVSTGLDPNQILNQIGEIESHFGRARRQGKYLSRKMDIDILFYDNLVYESENLTIPHPQIENRKFVLVPLSELIPGYIHPKSGISIAKMLELCNDMSEIIKIATQEKNNS